MITFQEDRHLYHDARGNPVPSVTYMLRRTGVVEPVRPYMRRALLRGRAVHKAIELFLRGTLDLASVDAVVMPYFECFLDWLAKHESQFKRMRPEVIVEHRDLGYCGKADVVAWEPGLGMDAVLDWKTGEEEGWHLTQGALYCLAQNARRLKGAMPFVVYLWPKKGWKTVTPDVMEDVARDALAVVRTFNQGRGRHLAHLAALEAGDEDPE